MWVVRISFNRNFKKTIGFIFYTLFCYCQLSCHSNNHPVNSFSDPIAYNNQRLYLDPSTLPDSELPLISDPDLYNSLLTSFIIKIKDGSIDSRNFQKYTPVLFSCRDSLTADLFRKIIKDTSVQLYYRMLSVYALGEYGDNNDFPLLYGQISHNNPVYREYIASALVKIAKAEDLSVLQSLTADEQNAYVRKTLLSKKGDWSWIQGNLPIYDTVSVKKELFFLNAWSGLYNLFTYKQIDSASETPVAKHCIYPHLQYKENRYLYELINYPLISFGFKDDWGVHVGEDSGWLFPGLAVHAIMDGIVMKIQHESTWGCLLIIQSRLADSSFVTTYYGHLSYKINVSVGDIVSMGDRIGETALSFSITNGGYLSHLHLGIEKNAFMDALVKGWYDTDYLWYSPVAFIARYNKLGNKKR